MTDEELSMLLRHWEPTPAPPSLDARVFDAGYRKARRWTFPAPAIALAGAAAGVLGVLGVLRLTMPVTHTPPPPPVVEQVALPAAPAAPNSVASATPPLAQAPPTPTPARNLKAERTIAFAMDPIRAARNILVAPPPVYPPDARAALVEGQVKLRVRIGRDGRVIDAGVVSGDPLLVDAAIESAKQWLFQPTRLNGELVEVITQIDVNFKLLDPPPMPAVKK
jgi:TonB family protein